MSERCETCGQTTEYNGRTNYETWAVKLWIDNEQSSQDYWLQEAREALRAAPKDDTVQRGLFTSAQRAVLDLADLLKDEYGEWAPEVSGVYSDLLGAALSSVNWMEIARELLEDMEDVLGDDEDEDE